MSKQLEIVSRSLEILAEASPIALISLKRNVERIEIQGGEIAHLKNGLIESSPQTNRYRIRVVIEFDGYTRALRDFLNLMYRQESGVRIAALSVSRSKRSEADRSDDLIEGGLKRNSSEISIRSPFAAYLQADEDSMGEVGTETKPLIGEVVSRFRVTLEGAMRF